MLTRFTVFVSVCLITVGLFITSCKSRAPKKNTTVAVEEKDNEEDWQFREMLVKGTDTGMIRKFKEGRVQISEVLCQRWEATEQEENNVSFPTATELSFFPDSQVVLNPRGLMEMGKWSVSRNDQKLFIHLHLSNSKEEFLLRSITSRDLSLSEMRKNGGVNRFELYSDGLVHENMFNDPFHPSNMKWRIKPKKSENDSLVYRRVMQCVRFFALYYRDNLKRDESTINFLGLPKIFTWYSGGIGLPDKEDVDDSWIDCFYNKTQAMKGYAILRSLIVDYEFNWDKKAPNWVYQTHSVLEQMYMKMEQNESKMKKG